MRQHNKTLHLAAALLFMSLGSASAQPAKGVSSPDPVADYDFVGWLGDALGNGATLTEVGAPPATFTLVDVGGVDRQALSVPIGNGLRLAVGPLLPLDTYSVAMIVSLASTSSYAKLIDTNDRQSDLGLYALANNLRYYTGGSANTGSFTANTLRQVVVTRAADGTYTGYLDGVEQFSFADADGSQVTAISTARVLHFLRDDFTTSEESDAVLHRIRLFDRALSQVEVVALEADRTAVLSIFRNGGFEGAP